MRIITTVILLFLCTCAQPQGYTTSTIFAHNDYARPVPFHTAYDLQVGYIEADVFLVDNQLCVAHYENEIESGRTLEELYLKPLKKKILQNNGHVYSDTNRNLTLMIDLKTEGAPTLDAIVSELKRYPTIISCPSLTIMISGSVPDPNDWSAYPDFITFDGRPHITYTSDQMKRIRMISTSFRDHVKWDGTGRIPHDAVEKMTALRDAAHAHNKVFRFWATPDAENAWSELMRLDMDVIVTDRVTELADYLEK